VLDACGSHEIAACSIIAVMAHRLLRLTAIALLIAAATVTAQNGSHGSGFASIDDIASPAGPNSGQPQLSSSTRGVLLSWIERKGEKAALRFSERTTTGWSTPRTVASGSDWFVNWADVPSVIRFTDGTLVGHWLQKSGPDAYAYDVRLSYSKDDGQTWSASFSPHSDGTKTEHGFASLFQMPDSGFGVIWLDGRSMTPHSGHGGHGDAAGAMSVRFATFDTSWKKTSEAPVDLRVCECCPTTAAVTSDGPITAFRNRTDDEVRDIYLSRLESGKWTEPGPVHRDGWKINACPVNGPMLSARGRDVAIAWFAGTNTQGRAFVAFSRDAGRSFGPPIRLDDAGALGRVDVELMPDGSAVASWIEFANQRAHFKIRRVDPSGARTPSTTVSAIAAGRASGYPRIASHGDELVFAWTEDANGRSQVRTAVARRGADRRR
jgi:hypothetical protein